MWNTVYWLCPSEKRCFPALRPTHEASTRCVAGEYQRRGKETETVAVYLNVRTPQQGHRHILPWFLSLPSSKQQPGCIIHRHILQCSRSFPSSQQRPRYTRKDTDMPFSGPSLLLPTTAKIHQEEYRYPSLVPLLALLPVTARVHQEGYRHILQVYPSLPSSST